MFSNLVDSILHFVDECLTKTGNLGFIVLCSLVQLSFRRLME